MFSRYCLQFDQELYGDVTKASAPLDSVRGHAPDRIRKQGMPVPVSPVDRQGKVAGFQCLFQGGDQRTVLAVDRADPVKMMVVFRDLHHPFPGDAPALEHALEEGDDIIRAFGTSEGYQEQCVVVQRASSPHGVQTPYFLAMVPVRP